MTRFPRSLWLVVLLAAMPAHAAGLPDTGQDKCYNDTGADSMPPGSLESIDRDTGTHPRQDCRYGRDPAAIAGHLTKTGGGTKGFDYTKIANNGNPLPASASLGTANTDWACTRDNVTGLTWEVKVTANPNLRSWVYAYTWYDTNVATNGGNAGNPISDTCNGTLPGTTCNTKAFAAAVNAIQLCTYSDWRLPTRRELLTLTLDGSSPSIDANYFPNSHPYLYWTATTYAPTPANAWFVDFLHGQSGNDQKSAITVYPVRLVRGGLL